MLYLSRKIGESIVINNSIEVTLVEVRGKTAKLGFTFPSDASILRKELFEKIRAQNLEAAQGGAGEGENEADLLAEALFGSANDAANNQANETPSTPADGSPATKE